MAEQEYLPKKRQVKTKGKKRDEPPEPSMEFDFRWFSSELKKNYIIASQSGQLDLALKALHMIGNHIGAYTPQAHIKIVDQDAVAGALPHDMINKHISNLLEN